MKTLQISFFILFCLLCFSSVYSQLKVNSEGSLEVNSVAADYEKSNWTKVHNRYTIAYNLWNNYYKKDVFGVLGDGKVYSSYVYLTESDKKHKTNIKTIESPLEKLKQISGVRYNRFYSKQKLIEDTVNVMPAYHLGYKTEEELEPAEYGLIAQDLEEVIPEAVFTMQDSTKAIAYSTLIPVLIEAIKAQQAQIESMEATINEHEIKISNTNTSRKWRLKRNRN